MCCKTFPKCLVIIIITLRNASINARTRVRLSHNSSWTMFRLMIFCSLPWSSPIGSVHSRASSLCYSHLDCGFWSLRFCQQTCHRPESFAFLGRDGLRQERSVVQDEDGPSTVHRRSSEQAQGSSSWRQSLHRKTHLLAPRRPTSWKGRSRPRRA